MSSRARRGRGRGRGKSSGSKQLNSDSIVNLSNSESINMKNYEAVDQLVLDNSVDTSVTDHSAAPDVMKMKEQLFCEMEDIQKKVSLSLRMRKEEIQKLQNINEELCQKNEELLEKNEKSENEKLDAIKDSKALAGRIHFMVEKKEILEIQVQGEKDLLTSSLQDKDTKISKLVELIVPLRKKVGEQEILREQLNQATGENKSLNVVNEELKKEMSAAKIQQEELKRKENEIDLLRQKTEKLLEHSKKELSAEKSNFIKERQSFTEEKKSLEEVKMKVEKEQMHLGQDLKDIEDLKLKMNEEKQIITEENQIITEDKQIITEEKQIITEEKKAIDEDKMMLDNEWGDIMTKKKELENILELSNLNAELSKETQEKLDKMENAFNLLKDQDDVKDAQLKESLMEKNFLKDKLKVMKECFKKDVFDSKAKYLEVSTTKELLDDELKSKDVEIVSLQDELSTSKQNHEEMILSYKVNQRKVFKTIIKQKEEEIERLKQQISEIMLPKKRKQKSDDSRSKKIKSQEVGSESLSKATVRELPRIVEETESDEVNAYIVQSSAGDRENIEEEYFPNVIPSTVETAAASDDPNTGLAGVVKNSPVLHQIDDFEAFMKTSRNKTQQIVEELPSVPEEEDPNIVHMKDPDYYINEHYSLQNFDELAGKNSLIQQTGLINSTVEQVETDQTRKSVRDIFDDSEDSCGDDSNASQPSTSREGSKSEALSSHVQVESTKASLPSLTPSFPALSPPTMSNSPAQTSVISGLKKPYITVKDINTMSSFIGQDVIIPNMFHSYDAAMDISEDDVNEKELKNSTEEKENERKLKFEVAGVVKNCLNKFYKTSVYAIQTKEDFEVLAAELSNQFRQDMMDMHRLAHSSLAGLVLTQENKSSIIDQIFLHFQVKKNVHHHLLKFFPPNSSQFISNLSMFTNLLSSEIKASYRAMNNSLAGITLSPDNDLWIKTKIDISIS